MNESVKRWDVYDAADHLDDVPWMLAKARREQDWELVAEVIQHVEDWTAFLWAASKRGGEVGPYPLYQEL